jgi:hypothetical protein
MMRLNQYESIGGFQADGSLELARNLHRDNYMYVEYKDDKIVRIENHMIWRSWY